MLAGIARCPAGALGILLPAQRRRIDLQPVAQPVRRLDGVTRATPLHHDVDRRDRLLGAKVVPARSRMDRQVLLERPAEILRADAPSASPWLKFGVREEL